MYVTSKLNNGFHRPQDARRGLRRDPRQLGLERIDLFLVHWPLPTRYDGDFVSTWRAMAAFVEDGRAASVGVSNFQPAHLQRIVDETGVVPAVNQVEVHPFFGNEAVRAANAEHGIATEAWSRSRRARSSTTRCITEHRRGARRDARAGGPALARRARRHRLPEVGHPGARSRENFEIFGFSLTPEEVGRISALDRGEDGRTGPNPDVFDYIPE